ncbi:MAG TPA: hydroxyphenylacetyl-CoA thioesterase PaaI [Ilumatobacteraceae bacterium]|nr:hydroxyphenylacetyl-CoA thioesterase PaaI [Ilumatobacteraceae bacterium]
MGTEAVTGVPADTGDDTGDGSDGPTDGTVRAADVVAELHRRDDAARAFGIELLDAGPGRAVVEMAVRADMCNGYDLCHGGMTFTLADTAMAFASGSHNQTALAAAASIDFLRPVPSGAVLRATAEERWLKGRTGLYDVRVELDDGSLVAMFHGRTVRAGGAVVIPDRAAAKDGEIDDLDTRGGA